MRVTHVAGTTARASCWSAHQHNPSARPWYHTALQTHKTHRIAPPTCSIRPGTALHRRVLLFALAKPGDDVVEEAPEGSTDDDAKSDAYSQEMQSKMGGSLEYRHELGINFHRILPDLIHDELGVGTILCLQKDSDMEYFNLDIQPIQAACRSLGIAHVRFQIRDFDPFDLRMRLPDAARVCAEASAANRGPLYIHCTAGLGRAPAVAMAWMHWCKGYALDDAVAHLTSIRACNPKVQAIRQATVDVLYPQPAADVELVLTAATVQAAAAQGDAAAAVGATPSTVQVAGLDVGWGQCLPMQGPASDGSFRLCRRIAPGRYQYKFLVNGVWCCEDALPTTVDGDNVNNVLDVAPRGEPDPQQEAARARILAGGGLTAEEQSRMAAAVCGGRPWYRRLLAWFGWQ